MKKLDSKTSKSLEGYIKQLCGMHPASWMSVSIGETLKPETIVPFSNGAIDALSKWLIQNAELQVIVLPEPDWDIPDEWGIKAPKIVENQFLSAELDKHTSIGMTNYYLLPMAFPPSWAVTLCHEQDIHLAGRMASAIKKGAPKVRPRSVSD